MINLYLSADETYIASQYTIFFGVLENYSKKMKLDNQKVLLLIHNFIAHDYNTELIYVQIHFLP